MNRNDTEIDFKKDVNPNSLYELTALLGEGSYGAVYRARSRVVDCDEVAIKIIPDADDDMEALWREIRFLQVLRSPFVVSFIESLLFDNELWLVMELCDGGSLHDLKAAMKTTFNEEQLKYIIAYSTLGLQHLHSQMSIHRDVKSGNILITRDGRAKLGDFGISAQLTDTIMKRRTVIGSPYWMAPEVIQEASYDGKADIWSMGITLLELCEGNPPHFNVHPMRAIFIISSRPAPTLKEPALWSPEMVDFVSRCLVKDCESRATADDLVKHPWIAKAVKEIGPKCCGSPMLQNLITDHWTEIERIRLAKFKIPDSIPDDLMAAVAAVEVNQNNDLTINNHKVGNAAHSGDDYDNLRTFDRGSFKHQKSINGDFGDDNMATWRRNDDFGIPATRQQVRNLNLSRNSSRSTTPTNNRPRSLSGSSLNAGTMRTLLTGSTLEVSRSTAGRMISGDFKYDAKDEELVAGADVSNGGGGGGGGHRSTNYVAPSTSAHHVHRIGGGAGGGGVEAKARYDSPHDEDRGGTMLAAGGSMIRTPPVGNMDTLVRAPSAGAVGGAAGGGVASAAADGKGKKSDLQSALKYFREESTTLSPVASAKESPQHKEQQQQQEKSSAGAGKVGKAPAAAEAKGVMPPPAPTPSDVREMDSSLASRSSMMNGEDDELAMASFAVEYKKIILKQLSALKKQYRDDMEELTISYEKRRKALKEALHAIPTADADSQVMNNQKEGGTAVAGGGKAKGSSHDVNANRPLPAITKRQHQREDPVEYY